MEDPIDTLEHFVKMHPCSSTDDIEKVALSHHLPWLQSFVKYALLKAEAKRGAIWLYGAPNSGKTTLLKMVSEIFYTIPYTQTRGKFDVKYGQGKNAPQFICVDEGALDTFFQSKRDRGDAKLIFEGNGYIKEEKYRTPKKIWENLPLLLTSNSLPFILSPAAKAAPEQVDREDHAAFMARIKMHQLSKSFKNTDTFPYSVVEMAHMIHKMVP